MNKNHSFSQWVLLKEELEASLSACVDITDRFLACPRGHVQDPGRSWTSVASGHEGVASQHRRANKRLQTSSGVPAEIVSELPLHAAAITLPRSVFTSTQPFNQQRDWPERSLASNPTGCLAPEWSRYWVDSCIKRSALTGADTWAKERLTSSLVLWFKLSSVRLRSSSRRQYVLTGVSSPVYLHNLRHKSSCLNTD